MGAVRLSVTTVMEWGSSSEGEKVVRARRAPQRAVVATPRLPLCH